jgi:hypothetical protein
MSADYRWKITKNYVSSGGAKGIEGPYDADDSVTSNPVHFSLYDDDGILYAEGMLYGEYDGFEPLDDFGTPNWGASAIKIAGEWL